MTKNRANPIHGILLMAGFGFASFYIAGFEWVKALSLSPLIVGIVLGIIYANTIRNRLPKTVDSGIKFCTKQILRTGIVLYGFRLTVQDVVAVGVPALVVDAIIVCGTIFIGLFLGRLLSMDRDTALMTSTGSAICGAAAVLGAEPVVRCEPHKTSVAVSTVVIFGTLSMFLYPVMFRMGMLSQLSDMGVAIYTGSTLHEVAHVVGAGNAMDPDGAIGIAGNATIVKMIRVMMLAPVLLVMGVCLARRNKGNSSAGVDEKRKITVPWFAFGFLGVIVLNSLLQVWIGGMEPKATSLFDSAIAAINCFDTFLLTMAMAALGAETSWEKFRQAGAKPFLLAALLYIWLLGGGYLLCRYMVPAMM